MTVSLINSMGDDLSVVNAARVSFHKESHEITEADKGLIHFLMRNRHATPFEQVELQFRIRVPIKVAREWFRHRAGHFNEESTRYVKMRPDFYFPDLEDVRTQVGKPGNYSFESVDPQLAEDYLAALAAKQISDYMFYTEWLERGVAKELVSFELPLSLLTEFIWKVDLRNCLNFLSLRTGPDALREIRKEAYEVEKCVEEVAPITLEAWRDYGRKSL